MKKLIYDVAPHHVLVENGEEVHGDGEFEVTNERFLELLADPYVPVREPRGELSKLSRSDLNKVAEKAGVENPAELENKDAVIAAIDQAATVPQSPPAAESGEGQDSQEA